MVLDTTRLQPQSSGTPAPAILRPELHATYCVTFRGSKLPDTVGCLLWALVVLPRPEALETVNDSTMYEGR
jgi:hypothetical protein